MGLQAHMSAGERTESESNVATVALLWSVSVLLFIVSALRLIYILLDRTITRKSIIQNTRHSVGYGTITTNMADSTHDHTPPMESTLSISDRLYHFRYKVLFFFFFSVVTGGRTAHFTTLLVSRISSLKIPTGITFFFSVFPSFFYVYLFFLILLSWVEKYTQIKAVITFFNISSSSFNQNHPSLTEVDIPGEEEEEEEEDVAESTALYEEDKHRNYLASHKPHSQQEQDPGPHSYSDPDRHPHSHPNYSYHNSHKNKLNSSPATGYRWLFERQHSSNCNSTPEASATTTVLTPQTNLCDDTMSGTDNNNNISYSEKTSELIAGQKSISSLPMEPVESQAQRRSTNRTPTHHYYYNKNYSPFTRKIPQNQNNYQLPSISVTNNATVSPTVSTSDSRLIFLMQLIFIVCNLNILFLTVLLTAASILENRGMDREHQLFSIVIFSVHMLFMLFTALFFFIHGTRLFLLLQQVTSNNVMIAIRSEMSSRPKRMVHLILRIMVITFVSFAALLSKLAIMTIQQINFYSGNTLVWANIFLESNWVEFFYYVLLEFVPMIFLLLLCWHTHFNRHTTAQKPTSKRRRRNAINNQLIQPSPQEEEQSLIMNRGLFFNMSCATFEENILTQMNAGQRKKKRRKRKISNATNCSDLSGTVAHSLGEEISTKQQDTTLGIIGEEDTI